MPIAVPEFQLLLTRLAADLGIKTDRLLAQMGRLDQREALAFLTDAYPHVAAPYVQMAAQATAVYYGEQPVAPPPTGPAAPPPFAPGIPDELVPAELLAASARWAWLQAKPADALRGSAMRAVFNGSRDTMIYNAIRESAKWARYASANACSFCRVMATRGAVYTSEEAATSVVGRGVDLAVSDRRAIHSGLMTRDEALYRRSLYRNERQAKAAGAKVGDTRISIGATRGNREAGNKYHDRCHCIAVCVRPGDTYEPPPYVEQWEQDYVTAVGTAARAGETKGEYGAIDLKAVVRHMDSISSDRQKQSHRSLPKPQTPADPLPNVRRSTGRDLAADIAAINPNWRAGRQWQINCTRCAAAIELRARLYDVTAEPKPESVRDNGYASILSRWLSPDGTAAGQGGGLQATRSSNPADEALGMSSGSRVWDYLPAKGRGATNHAKAAADAAVAEWGDGARGFITVEWSKKAGGGAHIFNVENRGGKIVYLDGQSNQVDAADHWDRIKSTANSCRIVRTDDLTPTARVMEWTRERTDADDQLARNKAAMLARVGDRSLSPNAASEPGPGAQAPRQYPPVGGAGGPVPFTPDNPPAVTDEVLEHIIVGMPKRNGWDGGHGYGAGHGKSEYPEGWDTATIRTAIENVLANPDTIERRGATLLFRGVYEGVRIEARVRGRSQGKPKLWTAYPVED